jgi:sigma-E factor negative regulatory protein RseC
VIEETGNVIAKSGNDIWVQVIRKSTCAGCSARHGCGQGALARLSDGRANQVLVRNEGGARTGDQVVIGIDEALLLRASLLVYGLPLTALLLGALAGNALWPTSDAPAIVGAVAGLLSGFAVVRRHGKKSCHIKPVFLRQAVP